MIHTRPDIEFANLTDIGCERDQNEDAYAFWEPQGVQAPQGKGRLAVIADGMGGYDGGQEASRIAVQTVSETYATTPIADHQLALLTSVQAAHRHIQEYTAQHPDLIGMGTTCTAACVAEDLLHYVHVGDSRLYLLRAGSISQLTNDHSYVARLVRSGALSPAEAEVHPQRHILTAALGVGEEPAFDTPGAPLKLKAGDALLLCTDGLWGTMSNRELGELARQGTASEACRDLVHLARQRGGPDNITVQLLRISENGAGGSGP